MINPQGASSVLPAPAALPSGTVTFLLSDIEGSTERWERHPEAMKRAVSRQEQIMTAAVAKHDGYVFKTMGDAFCVAFHTAPSALRAAIEAQLALAREDFADVSGLRVRIALHTGYAEERNADYFGPAVNRAARLMAIGHGGQTLLSGVTRELASTDLPAGAALIHLGSHRLKDLTEPEQVWQLVLAALPEDFGPLKSLDTIPNNLPIQPTSFRGREHDLDEVKSRLREHKLLTVFGAGGVGKTRLALQVAADVLDQYSDGVWLADFAPINDAELVASVIAKALGVAQGEGRRVDEAIPQWLKHKKILLILDNCEHVLETVAGVADAIVRSCPDVRMLATTRQALDIAGETVYRLPSLATPEKASSLRTPEALQYGAIALFIDRAKASDSRFTLTDDNVPIVADICRRLDGIPLAIELAAARVKLLALPNLAHRLNERFKILTGGSRSALPRQKTLGALIDWSYDLLSSPEQTLFNRVGIFAGGFSLDAAEAVCSGDGLDESDILNLLSSLADKSLVIAETAGENERYRLLESTRAYALEKLDAGGDRERLGSRHAQYFRDQAEAADERFGKGSTFAWLDEMEQELDNYRNALEWGLSQGNDVVLGAAVAGALEQLWLRGGLSVEGRYWMEPALERVSAAEHPEVVARLLRALARLYAAKRTCDVSERAVRLYETAGNGHGAARALIHLAFGLYQMGRIEEAREANVRALKALPAYGDRGSVARCQMQLALIAHFTGAVAEGRELFAPALATYRALGDELGSAVVLGNLAELEFAEGHAQEALRCVSEALMTASRRGFDSINLAVYCGNSAAYRIALGDIEGANKMARECLEAARHAQDASAIAVALQHLALLMALSGRTESAARLIGYVDMQLKELGFTREPTEEWGYRKLNASLREGLGEAEIAKLGAEGAAYSEEQAIEQALAL